VKRERGQVLILVLLLVPTLLVFLAFLVNSGIAVRNRIKTQNSCDAVTLSAGHAYARTMNLLSFSNKAWAGFAMLDLASFLLDGIDPNTRQVVASAQDALLAAAPGVIVGEGLWIAKQNEFMHAVPPSPLIFLNGKALPSLPIKRRSIGDFLRSRNEPFKKKKVFSYQPQKYGKPVGERVFVSEDECYRDDRGRWRLKEKGVGGRSDIFVKMEDGKKGKELEKKMEDDPGFLDMLQFDLIETSTDHRVAVFGGAPGGVRLMRDRNLAGEQKLPANLALAEAGIGGGSLSIFNFEFKPYRASLIPVRLEDFTGGLPISLPNLTGK
jgi:hypothetical protein